MPPCTGGNGALHAKTVQQQLNTTSDCTWTFDAIPTGALLQVQVTFGSVSNGTSIVSPIPPQQWVQVAEKIHALSNASLRYRYTYRGLDCLNSWLTEETFVRIFPLVPNNCLPCKFDDTNCADKQICINSHCDAYGGTSARAQFINSVTPFADLYDCENRGVDSVQYELAAFFANVIQETGYVGGKVWPTPTVETFGVGDGLTCVTRLLMPDDLFSQAGSEVAVNTAYSYKQGLCYLDEGGDDSKNYTSRWNHGLGSLQLTGIDNAIKAVIGYTTRYNLSSPTINAYVADNIKHPPLGVGGQGEQNIFQNTTLMRVRNNTYSWNTGLWYWYNSPMNGEVGEITAHGNMLKYGINGMTEAIKNINGALECLPGADVNSTVFEETENRIYSYVRILAMLDNTTHPASWFNALFQTLMNQCHTGRLDFDMPTAPCHVPYSTAAQMEDVCARRTFHMYDNGTVPDPPLVGGIPMEFVPLQLGGVCVPSTRATKRAEIAKTSSSGYTGAATTIRCNQNGTDLSKRSSPQTDACPTDVAFCNETTGRCEPKAGDTWYSDTYNKSWNALQTWNAATVTEYGGSTACGFTVKQAAACLFSESKNLIHGVAAVNSYMYGQWSFRGQACISNNNICYRLRKHDRVAIIAVVGRCGGYTQCGIEDVDPKATSNIDNVCNSWKPNMTTPMVDAFHWIDWTPAETYACDTYTNDKTRITDANQCLNVANTTQRTGTLPRCSSHNGEGTNCVVGDTKNNVDWCASVDHPHFDLDLATLDYLLGSESGQGSGTLDRVEPVECPIEVSDQIMLCRTSSPTSKGSGAACLSDSDCDNGGNCAPGWKCNCTYGWTGVNCDLCDGAEICSSQGTCDSPTSNCTCNEGWHGPHCSNCTQGVACNHGNGTCHNASGPGFPGTCSCNANYTGLNCEECNGDTFCSGHGTCKTPAQPDCACEPGWNGHDCSVCDSSVLCNGRGQCESVKGTCACEAGYTGASCAFPTTYPPRRFMGYIQETYDNVSAPITTLLESFALINDADEWALFDSKNNKDWSVLEAGPDNGISIGGANDADLTWTLLRHAPTVWINKLADYVDTNSTPHVDPKTIGVDFDYEVNEGLFVNFDNGTTIDSLCEMSAAAKSRFKWASHAPQCPYLTMGGFMSGQPALDVFKSEPAYPGYLLLMLVCPHNIDYLNVQFYNNPPCAGAANIEKFMSRLHYGGQVAFRGDVCDYLKRKRPDVQQTPVPSLADPSPPDVPVGNPCVVTVPQQDMSKYLITLPATVGSAGSGYATPDEVSGLVHNLLSKEVRFGGMSFWSVGQDRFPGAAAIACPVYPAIMNASCPYIPPAYCKPCAIKNASVSAYHAFCDTTDMAACQSSPYCKWDPSSMPDDCMPHRLYLQMPSGNIQEIDSTDANRSLWVAVPATTNVSYFESTGTLSTPHGVVTRTERNVLGKYTVAGRAYEVQYDHTCQLCVEKTANYVQCAARSSGGRFGCTAGSFLSDCVWVGDEASAFCTPDVICMHDIQNKIFRNLTISSTPGSLRWATGSIVASFDEDAGGTLAYDGNTYTGSNAAGVLGDYDDDRIQLSYGECACVPCSGKSAADDVTCIPYNSQTTCDANPKCTWTECPPWTTPAPTPAPAPTPGPAAIYYDVHRYTNSSPLTCCTPTDATCPGAPNTSTTTKCGEGGTHLTTGCCYPISSAFTQAQCETLNQCTPAPPTPPPTPVPPPPTCTNTCSKAQCSFGGDGINCIKPQQANASFPSNCTSHDSHGVCSGDEPLTQGFQCC